MQWHVYELGPIDFHWDRLKSVKEVRSELSAEQGSGLADGNTFDLATLERAWQDAQDAALEAGWDGGHRNDPVVFWVPAKSEFDFGFVIKQDNNGTTYVVSPVGLPHLER